MALVITNTAGMDLQQPISFLWSSGIRTTTANGLRMRRDSATINSIQNGILLSAHMPQVFDSY